jgi:glycogen phosphorylase
MTAYKDPVCGMTVDGGRAPSAGYGGRTFHFCSEYCRQQFQAEPERYVGRAILPASELLPSARRIAYFSMEVAIRSDVSTYSGGLGVLAGDSLRSCADLNMPVVAVSLLYRRGYFHQQLDESGWQHETEIQWTPEELLRPLAGKASVDVEGRAVKLRAWQYDVPGASGGSVPLILLDANLDENELADRELTARLYGGDERYRLAQEAILGIGGVRMLRALGYNSVERFHMNEGHAALLVLELLRESAGQPRLAPDFGLARARCVFTTHTPVPAGHDQFSYDLVRSTIGDLVPGDVLRMLGGEERLNMTRLALNASHYVNGVAKRHGEVSREMFAGYQIDSITNGVHSYTWTCESFRRLYDRHVPGWANDPFTLRYAVRIPKSEIWDAHQEAKYRLIAEVNRRTGRSFDTESFTLGFARRATPYKRPELLLSDASQLAAAARDFGPLQIIYGGKAHPRDQAGKEAIKRIAQAAAQLPPEIRVVYLEEYDLQLAQLLTSGVDLWVNTPLRPLEASGTSGMKAAHNGVPSLSVLDGWWLEGHLEGVTGWAIGICAGEGPVAVAAANARDAEDLYRSLRAVVAPLFYQGRDRWVDVMRNAIAFNASFFNTHRMVQQYAANAYV